MKSAKRYLTMVSDSMSERGPKNETLAEHRKHCKAEKGECPFEQRADEPDAQVDEGAKRSLVTPEEDAAYADAVKRGDRETALRMVREAAARAMPDTKVVDDEGLPAKVFHGTVREFNVFNKTFCNPECDLGCGYYFSNSEADVDANYATVEGPDLVNRLELLAERIENESDFDNETIDHKEALRRAREQLKIGEGRKIAGYLNMVRPFEIGSENRDVGSKSTWLDYSSEYDEEKDEYSEPKGALVDFLNNLQNVLDDHDVEGIDLGAILERAYDYDGMTAAELSRITKELLSDAYDMEIGELAGNEFFREAVERSGYDGIIDKTVNRKFGTTRQFGQSMSGMSMGTTHYVVFNSSQIKSADITFDDNGNLIPLSKRFNMESEDIRDEATGKVLECLKSVDAEDASLEWTEGVNPELKHTRKARKPIDRLPKKLVKQIIVENCKLIKTVDEDLLPLVAGKVYGMMTGKIAPDEFIDWCVDECGVEEWQAIRIARDQIVKAQEWIKLADWKKRGVNFVMWCHSNKDKEPRDYHIKQWDGRSGIRNGKPNGLDGFVFRIDDPPVIDKKTGQRGMPSTLIGCKCFLKGIRGA